MWRHWVAISNPKQVFKGANVLGQGVVTNVIISLFQSGIVSMTLALSLVFLLP